MAKYRVLVELPIYHSTSLEIEADTPQQANAKAFEQARKEKYPETWGSPSYGDPEILEVEEVKE